MKVPIGAFNQEKALAGSLSVIVKTDGSFAALVKTVQGSPDTSGAQVVSPRLIIRPEHIGPELQQLYL